MDLKKPLPFDELADKMEEHHLVVNDRSEAIRVLQHISYYRLSGYLLPYRLSQNDSDLKDVAFEDLMAIYNFDSDLRNFLRKYIEIAEVYYRTQISHWFSLSRCSAPPHDQHYDDHNFYRKQSYHDVMRKYESDKAEYYGDSLVMRHHRERYGGHEPLWVITEILSFSNLSKLYNSMYYSDKDLIANAVGTGREVLSNHLHCITILRNKCAHAARLYNTRMSKPVQLPAYFLRANLEIKNNSLFAYIIMLLKRLPDDPTKKDYIAEFTRIVEKYRETVDMRFIGIPDKCNYNAVLAQNRYS